MRAVPIPWPSEARLNVLVKRKSDPGLFIYVSTLVEFVTGTAALTESDRRDTYGP